MFVPSFPESRGDGGDLFVPGVRVLHQRRFSETGLVEGPASNFVPCPESFIGPRCFGLVEPSPDDGPTVHPSSPTVPPWTVVTSVDRRFRSRFLVCGSGPCQCRRSPKGRRWSSYQTGAPWSSTGPWCRSDGPDRRLRWVGTGEDGRPEERCPVRRRNTGAGRGPSGRCRGSPGPTGFRRV